MVYCIPRYSFHLASPGSGHTEEPLTKSEKTLRKVLSKIKGKDAVSGGIRIALAKRSIPEFRRVIRELKDQLRDAPALTEKIIGTEAFELLKQL